MGIIHDALTRAIAGLPGRAPKGFTAQARALGGRGAHPEQRLARIFGITPRTAKRWLTGGTTTKANRAAAQRATDAVVERRKLRRAQAAAAAGGLRVETRAMIGYTASPGSSDDPRVRRITATVPARFANALFDAYKNGDEQGMNLITANSILFDYFKDKGRRAHDLDIEFNQIDYLDFDIRE